MDQSLSSASQQPPGQQEFRPQLPWRFVAASRKEEHGKEGVAEGWLPRKFPFYVNTCANPSGQVRAPPFPRLGVGRQSSCSLWEGRRPLCMSVVAVKSPEAREQGVQEALGSGTAEV